MAPVTQSALVLLAHWLFRRRIGGWQLLMAGLALFLGGAAYAQPAGPFRLARPHQRQARVPYLAQRNLIIVSAQLNGQGPYNFVLDTGVNISLLLDSSLQEPLHLVAGRAYRVAGLGQGQAVVAHEVNGVRVTLPGGATADSLSFLMLAANDLNFSGYVGLPIHGILGADVFRSFVVRLHPTAGVLTLYAPARYRAPRGRRWTSLPLDLHAGKPYLTTRITTRDSATAPLQLLLDTGAGHSLSLDVKSHPQLRFPEPGIRSALGRGLSGVITGYLGRTASLQLGSYALHAVMTSFPDTARAVRPAFEGFRNGSLGYEALNRFVSVIDYSHNRLLLRPGPTYGRPFEQDVSGLEIEASGPEFRRYRITLVQAGSPAAEAGLQEQDELLFVNFIPAASLSFSQLHELLRDAVGHRLTLVVRRADGELGTAELALKRRL